MKKCLCVLPLLLAIAVFFTPISASAIPKRDVLVEGNRDSLHPAGLRYGKVEIVQIDQAQKTVDVKITVTGDCPEEAVPETGRSNATHVVAAIVLGGVIALFVKKKSQEKVVCGLLFLAALGQMFFPQNATAATSQRTVNQQFSDELMRNFQFGEVLDKSTGNVGLVANASGHVIALAWTIRERGTQTLTYRLHLREDIDEGELNRLIPLTRVSTLTCDCLGTQQLPLPSLLLRTAASSAGQTATPENAAKLPFFPRHAPKAAVSTIPQTTTATATPTITPSPTPTSTRTASPTPTPIDRTITVEHYIWDGTNATLFLSEDHPHAVVGQTYNASSYVLTDRTDIDYLDRDIPDWFSMPTTFVSATVTADQTHYTLKLYYGQKAEFNVFFRYREYAYDAGDFGKSNHLEAVMALPDVTLVWSGEFYSIYVGTVVEEFAMNQTGYYVGQTVDLNDLLPPDAIEHPEIASSAQKFGEMLNLYGKFTFTEGQTMTRILTAPSQDFYIEYNPNQAVRIAE